MTLEPLTAPLAATPSEPQIPLPPHDPRDRDFLLRVGGGAAGGAGEWEVRSFDNRWFAFFGPRGLWHVQLWNPAQNVSILTPSGLTRGTYEVNSSRAQGPSTGPIRAIDYPTLARIVSEEHGVTAPSEERMAWIESVFVRRILSPGESLQ